ncbi:MAG: thrombospondin type 3 repeat-containing protein [Nitrososphaera sp.]
MIKNNNIPHLRKEASTFLALSAAAMLLLLMMTSSSLPLFNLVPAQAQSSVSFQTVQPAQGTLCTGEQAYLTFDAQGTTSSSGSSILKMTGGTFQITDSSSSRQILYSGNIQRGEFNDNGQDAKISLAYFVNHVSDTAHPCTATNDLFFIYSSCSTSESNSITTHFSSGNEPFTGGVECSLGDTTTTTQQSSSSVSGSTTTTAQDRDRDGIPDANDNCPNLPNTRCYKEGDRSVVVHNSNR